jgi:hypothetical protein
MGFIRANSSTILHRSPLSATVAFFSSDGDIFYLLKPKQMKTKAVMTIMIALFSEGLFAQAGVILSDDTGWHKIGETTVDFKKEKDEIRVVGANRFASLKFKVTDAPVDIIDMEVHYDKADIQNIRVNSPVQAGAESRVIDLKGAEPDIRKIVFVYKTLPNRKDEKAKVEIWGYKTNVEKDKDKEKEKDKDKSHDGHKH